MVKNKSGKTNPAIWILVAVVVVGAWQTGLLQGILPGADGIADADDDGTTINVRDVPGTGKSSTITLDMYDYADDAHPETWEEYFIVKSDGTFLIDNAPANSTTAEVDDEITIYATGNQVYGKDPLTFSVTGEAPTKRYEAYDVGALTSMNVVIRDKNEDALTAITNANQTGNYSYAMGADDKSEAFYVKLENAQADKAYQLGAMCTYYMGNAKNFEVIESGWKEAARVPDQLDAATVRMYDNANTSYTGSWKECYVPSDGPIFLMENEDTDWIKMNAESKSTDPAANSGDYIGLCFFDSNFNKQTSDNTVVMDFYTHDDKEEVDDIGVNETTLVTGRYGYGYHEVPVETVCVSVQLT